ncbi:MAG: urease accessory UreF family protein [Cyanobacteriota bacterium]
MPGEPASLRSSGAFYLLLQLTDSALPIGAYSHSWGMETAVQAGHLRDRAGVLQYLLGVLHLSLAPGEGKACGLAYLRAQEESAAELRDLQAQLNATRWATEPRQASLDLGKRLAQLAERTWGIPPPTHAGEGLHHCLVFGWVCAAAGVGLEEALRAYLFSALVGWVSAAVRLVPLGHSDGQAILASLYEPIERVLQREILPNLNPELGSQLGGFAPLQERDCQAHQQLYSRLFQS